MGADPAEPAAFADSTWLVIVDPDMTSCPEALDVSTWPVEVIAPLATVDSTSDRRTSSIQNLQWAS